MVIGVGCDIVEHNTTLNLNWASDLDVQKRIFTSKELEIYAQKKDIQFLAGRFAAKEAVLKSLGTGMQDGIALTDIQILQTENEKPTIELNGQPKKISDTMNIGSWHLSISHSKEYTIAFAVAESI